MVGSFENVLQSLYALKIGAKMFVRDGRDNKVNISRFLVQEGDI